MIAPKLEQAAPRAGLQSRHYRQPLGQILVELGILGSEHLLHALALHGRARAPLARICIAEGFATEDQMRMALALQWGAPNLSRADMPPDAALADMLDPEFCRDHAILPWAWQNGTLLVATSRPEGYAAAMAGQDAVPDNAVMALASEAEIHAILADRHRDRFRRAAETQVPQQFSCRNFGNVSRSGRVLALLAGLAAMALLLIFPNHVFAALVLWATLTLVMAGGLKAAAFAAQMTRPGPAGAPVAGLPPGPLPRVSVLVPLFRESDIASTLIQRLNRLTYPRALLDIVLVLEEKDQATRKVVADTPLPPWIRVVEVPDGTVTTKPRALNYALGFCDGDIIGVYDAEDAPDPDQIDRVVARFADAPDDVVCLQGVLDYYNPQSTWLARCFTIEYATWFRIVLPGMARMRLAIPLGGTTMFCRRAALEQVCAWDAHNVTEDADLGIRLARFGYRTELLGSVTREEANNRLWPWIKQRSRWLKGFMITYLVHMRRPVALWRDLGPRQFLGFQVFFLTASSQFLFAPVLWSFWLVPLGVPHPLAGWIGAGALGALATFFLVSEALNLIIGMTAVSDSGHSRLKRWVPTMILYFPIGAAAAIKAMYELVLRPFYWDKTSHGHSLGPPAASPRKAPAPG